MQKLALGLWLVFWGLCAACEDDPTDLDHLRDAGVTGDAAIEAGG